MWVAYFQSINETNYVNVTSFASDHLVYRDLFQTSFINKKTRHAVTKDDRAVTPLTTTNGLPSYHPLAVTSETKRAQPFENNDTSLYEYLVFTEAWEEILIVSAYGFFFLMGIIGNVSVMVASCKTGTGQRHPNRNSLILALTIADLLITLLCYPINAMSLLLPYLTLPYPTCQVMIFVQGALHASSTFSMAFLAFDRFLTVRKPKTAPKVARWIPHILSALLFLVLVLSVPSGLLGTLKRSGANCRTRPYYHYDGKNRDIFALYYCVISLLVYIMPCAIVSFCHYKVASTLRQRGLDETRLQQRPKQVIIVAKDCSVVGTNTHKIVQASSSIEPSDADANHIPVTDSKNRKKRLKKPKFFTTSASQAANRPSRSMGSIIRAHRRMRIRRKVRATSILVDHRSQSFETRMRLAKLLLILAIMFCCCWIPYACVLFVWSIFDGKVLDVALNLSLLIGHSHSAFSPIVYWLMNRSILNSVQRIVSSYLHWPSGSEHMLCGLCPRPKCLRPVQSNWGNNSSTNEEALGPFHPKYINPLALRPPPSRCTSHYFH